jgi:fatty acid desaturase
MHVSPNEFNWRHPLVNSATHLWGKRRFATTDTSRNNLWVAMLTFGEGWHNNHHAHPQSARRGLAWYEFDVNWYGICALRALGPAWDVKAAKVAYLQEKKAISEVPPRDEFRAIASGYTRRHSEGKRWREKSCFT